MARTWNTESVTKTTVIRVSRGVYVTLAWYASIVLGITAWYLAHYDETRFYPQARLIYTIIIAGIACATAPLIACFGLNLKWMPLFNICLALAFFAAFGSVMEWDCDEHWADWRAHIGEPHTAYWKTLEAFTFISGFFWLVSSVLAYWAPYVKETEPERQKRLSTGTGSGSETV
ncbi:uncharacterized protein A1O9_09432 [Exophiala aquamarina CBS 119918]|uniref:MARVEL domain-containing protein n=1 Tax=Exophiala aquamarina CBS 119918 TaxID=1182545 RepID=A0A072P386_9EURO|nr:uncharacterized protein A1O9_09432 [Exophiala aquamarina CBS 119918]KEF54266.1 hypothetical protein A1O9_09432 [Exophiala aquamarina CBS 119918]